VIIRSIVWESIKPLVGPESPNGNWTKMKTYLSIDTYPNR
jgi:hypothetical protein